MAGLPGFPQLRFVPIPSPDAEKMEYEEVCDPDQEVVNFFWKGQMLNILGFMSQVAK